MLMKQLFTGKLCHAKHFVAFEKSAAGTKECKQRAFILLCCITTGTHKLKSLLIGKYYKNPRCLKHSN
jgi:hypothetical protein